MLVIFFLKSSFNSVLPGILLVKRKLYYRHATVIIVKIYEIFFNLDWMIHCVPLGDSIRPYTNGVSLLHRIASVAPLSKPQTMY